MAQYMDKVRDMLCAELEKVAQKGRLANIADVQLVDWLTHAVKSIDTIIAMEEAYSDDEHGYSENDGYSERYRRRDSMGRYSRRGGGYRGGSYNDGNGYRGDRGYSRGNSYADGKNDIIDQMMRMMSDAPTEQEREKVRRCIEQMQNG